MKLLFLILAHDRPEDAAALARTLVSAATDARALIHFDAGAKPAAFERLRTLIADEPRVALAETRIACRWGSFSLVEAPLKALAQVETEVAAGSRPAPDYVILLSGACLPCRPVAELERYLTENAGREFIESEDESWVTGGWRSERWKFWHWFDHKTQNLLELVSGRIQAAIGVRRRFPAGLTPRFGSQWWALTWPAIQAILADIRQNPKRLDFFRTVWIPDEMVIQTYVWALVPKGAITGFGLTHFQFTNRGKPIVFHEDHAAYVRTLNRFFFRKVSPEATSLRAGCLALAAEPDRGGSLEEIGVPRDDYDLKMRGQTHFTPAGALFYRDQFSDQTDPVLRRDQTPYVVIAGPPAIACTLAQRLPAQVFLPFGEIFAPDMVDFGPALEAAAGAIPGAAPQTGTDTGQTAFDGLRPSDVAIRDQHPALWLARLRSRAAARGRIPVIPWSPANHAWMLSRVAQDPAALVITLAPDTGDPARDRATLLRHSLGTRRMAGTRLPLGLPRQAVEKAVFESEIAGPDLAPWVISGTAGFGGASWLPVLRLAAGGRVPRVVRREALDQALAACRFRTAPWFPPLAATLASVYERRPALTPDEPERGTGHGRRPRSPASRRRAARDIEDGVGKGTPASYEEAR